MNGADLARLFRTACSGGPSTRAVTKISSEIDHGRAHDHAPRAPFAVSTRKSVAFALTPECRLLFTVHMQHVWAAGRLEVSWARRV